MALLFVLVAVVLGTLSPTIIPLSVLEEKGPVENVTIVFYLVDVATVLVVRTPALGRGDKAALCLLLLAFAAREADLHKAMFGISILGARLSRLDAPAGPAVAVSAGIRNSPVVLPLALAVPGASSVVPAIIMTQTMVDLVSSVIYMRLIPRLGAVHALRLAK